MADNEADKLKKVEEALGYTKTQLQLKEEILELEKQELEISQESKDLSKWASAELSKQLRILDKRTDITKRLNNEIKVGSNKVLELEKKRDAAKALVDAADFKYRRATTNEDKVAAAQEKLTAQGKKENLQGELTSQKAILRAVKDKQERNIRNVALTKQNVAALKNTEESLKAIDWLGDQIGDGYKSMKGFLMSMSSGGWKPLATLIKLSFERFIELDKAAGEFRKNTGLMVSQMGTIAKNARELNVEFAGFGVHIAEAYAAAENLQLAWQTTALVTKNAMGTVALMAANIGIVAEDSAKILRLFDSLSKSSGTTVEKVTMMGLKLAQVAGVAPRQVFEDMARASNETLIFLGKNPMELMRTAISARRAGTSIDSMSKSARGFLNFQESITSEMEASALLGKSVNFQLARQYAFEGKVEQSRRAAMNQLKQIGDFSKLNAYQQEALAKASGMTVEEIIKQQTTEKQFAAIRRSGNDELIKQLDMYEQANAAAKEGKEDLVKGGEELLKSAQRQTVMTNINNSLREAMTALSDALLPIAASIMPAIVFGAKALAGIFQVIGKGMTIWAPIWSAAKAMTILLSEGGKFARVGASISSAFSRIVSFFSGFKIVGSVVGWFKSIGVLIAGFATKFSLIGKVFGFLSKFGGFLKVVPVIGWIITGIQLIVSLWKRFSDLFASSEWAKGDWMDRIWLGIKAVGGALYDVLLKPFVDIWDYLKVTFFGNSPSQLGLLIVKGLSAVGGMLFDSIMSPFKMAWEAIKNLPFAKSLFGGAKDAAKAVTADFSSKIEAATSSVIEIKNLDGLKDVVDKLANAVLKLGSTPSTVSVAGTNNNDNSDITDKLDELIGLMRDGGIAVNLDGRKVSKALAR